MICIRMFLLCSSLFFFNTCWCFSCYYTLAKDNCWTQFNVVVDVIDYANSNKLVSVTVPAGKGWARQKFECQPGQNLMYTAQFNPIIWENDKGKKYSAQHSWFLPGKINPGDSAWEIPICFPADFSEVPASPTSSGQCTCDFTQIPGIPPKQK